MKLQEVLNQKEGSMWEFKSARIEAKDLAKTLIAFANTDGGTIAIGIEKDKTISGIRAQQENINLLLQASINFIEPPIKLKTEYIGCLNKDNEDDRLLLLEVNPSDRVHCNTRKETFIRVGDQTRKIGLEQILELAYDRGQANYEYQSAKGSSLSDIDYRLFNKYKEKLGLESKAEEVLLARELAIGRRDKLSLTLGGVLLFAKKPTRWLPKASIRFLKYEGTEEKYGDEMNLIKDVLIADLPLPKLLDETFRIVNSQLKEFSKPGKDGKFKTIPEYPEFAWQEAIVNAVAHRSYSITGSNIFVKMLSNRLEVISPGGLPGNIKKENILSSQFSRNPRIARVLAELDYIKEMGEGLNRMFREMKEAGLSEPDIITEANQVILILKNIKCKKEIYHKEEIEEYSLNKRQREVLEYIKTEGNITNREYRRLFNVHRDTAHSDLSTLCKIGVLDRIGEGRAVRYILKSDDSDN
ncbi:MAG: hypothetical protein COS84_04755 [Armatimonadetes bacterium CG07_land_8_20_14_0_80_40_9]|nr:MAG: hypothetical protein COS84_04755 [Armatimonadetes bacterium CG07_land_8_20_14_0_80_40_9]